jgi:hypothetical protein
MTDKRECWSANNEEFNCESLDELLDSDDQLKAGDNVYVGEAVMPSHRQLCSADDVIEAIGERAYDIVGEAADDFPDATPEARAELDALLGAWMQKHCTINFYQVKNVRPYVLTIDDVPPESGGA